MIVRVVAAWTCLLWLSVAIPLRADAQRPADAEAQEPPEYRALINEALAEYEGHNFAEARALFLRAHDVLPSARTLRGLGMAEFELKNYGDSVLRLEAALASSVKRLEGELRQQTEELLARARTFVARIRLQTTPAAPVGTHLFLDGEPVSAGPEQTLTISVGEHVLLVQAPGYEEEKRTLSVKGAEQKVLTIALRKQVESAPPQALQRLPERKDEPRPLRRNPWLWTGVSALVVGGVVAGLVLGLRKDKSPPEENPDFMGTIGGSRVDTLIAR